MRYRVWGVRSVGCVAIAFSTALPTHADWFGGGNSPQATASPVYSSSAEAYEQLANYQPGSAIPTQSSFADRAERMLSHNPISWAWGKMKKGKRAQVATSQPVWQRYASDPLALQNGYVDGNQNPTASLWISAAQISERSGDLVGAERQYRQALTQHPQNPEVLLSCARFEDRQGKLQRAEALYAEALRHNPQSPAIMNDLGLCLARQGRFADALPVLGNAIQLSPSKPLYRNNIATVLVELDRNEDALRELSAVHGEAVAYYNLGALLSQREKVEKAIACYQAALAQDPSLEPARLALGALGPAEDQVVVDAGVEEDVVKSEEASLAGNLDAPSEDVESSMVVPTPTPAFVVPSDPVRQAVQPGPMLLPPQAQSGVGHPPVAAANVAPGYPTTQPTGPGFAPPAGQPATARLLPGASGAYPSR